MLGCVCVCVRGVTLRSTMCVCVCVCVGGESHYARLCVCGGVTLVHIHLLIQREAKTILIHIYYQHNRLQCHTRVITKLNIELLGTHHTYTLHTTHDTRHTTHHTRHTTHHTPHTTHHTVHTTHVHTTHHTYTLHTTHHTPAPNNLSHIHTILGVLQHPLIYSYSFGNISDLTYDTRAIKLFQAQHLRA